MKTKILFTAFEATPFAKTGGLADVAGSLPAAVKNDEYDVRVILPKLSIIPEKYQAKMQFVTNYTVPLAWREAYCGLFRLRLGGVTYYFLDNEYYFHRDRLYGEYDDGERMAFFSMAVCETIKHISRNFRPDIIHCNDWHTALVPVFLHEHYRDVSELAGIRTVFTIHNLKFQGQYDKCIIGDILGLQDVPAAGQFIHNDAVNYLQSAVIYSDAVTTVSSTYAEEICTPQYGEGLDGLFRSRRYKLSGIVNGIDTRSIDPETDKAIAVHYGVKDITDPAPDNGKLQNKLALQAELGLEQDADKPLFVMVSRLTEQKGANLVRDLLSELARRDMQLAILGTGDREFEDAFRAAAAGLQGRFAARIEFDESLSRRFYAGADVFMMPSQFEPCGLAQMMAMRYGTLPMVRETGGLRDTVKGYWDHGTDACGFSFKDFDTNALITTVDQAIALWYDEPEKWKKLQLNAMSQDFSWDASAEKYRELYSTLK